MDYNKYWLGGWGLHEKQLRLMSGDLKNTKTLVEFGSGASTQFYNDFMNEYDIDIDVTTFDNDPNYAYKGKYDRGSLNLSIVSVVDGFYDITESNLPDSIDMVILDGPNGIGRSKAFELLTGKVSKGCKVMIDDSEHYPFVDKFLEVFPDAKLIERFDGRETIHRTFCYAYFSL